MEFKKKCLGIPKQKRGQVWQFFASQSNLVGDLPNASSYSHINLDVPYEHLLRQLTSQQHAILIDLGMRRKRIYFLMYCVVIVFVCVIYDRGILIGYQCLQDERSHLTLTLAVHWDPAN